MRKAMQMQGSGRAAARPVPAGTAMLVVVLAAAILTVLATGGTLGVARGFATEPCRAGPAAALVPFAAAAVVHGEGVQVTAGLFEAEPVGGPPRVTSATAVETPASAVAAGDAPAMRRVAVYLKVRNVGVRVATFTPLDVALRDSEGEVYAAFNREWSRSPALPGAALRPGEQVEGWRVFEVPSSVNGFVLLYRSDAMDSGVDVRLPRLRGAVHDLAPEPLPQ